MSELRKLTVTVEFSDISNLIYQADSVKIIEHGVLELLVKEDDRCVKSIYFNA